MSKIGIIICIYTHNNIGEFMKIKIRYIEENKGTNKIKNKNYIGIYILGIRVKKIIVDRDIKAKKNSNKNLNEIYMLTKQIIRSLKKDEILEIISDLFKSMKVKRLNLELGINLNDPIANAYSIACINVVLPVVLAYNSRKINLADISYNTFISNKMLYLRIDAVILISIFKNLKSIFKLIFKRRGVKNKN